MGHDFRFVSGTRCRPRPSAALATGTTFLSAGPLTFYSLLGKCFCVRRRRQARVPLFRPLFFVDTGWRRRTCVHQTDMMLIMHGTASAWHLDMGDSIFFLLFFPFSVPLASLAAGAFTGVLGAGEERHHYTGRNFGGGASNTDDIPPAGAIRLEKETGDTAIRDVAQAHTSTTRAESNKD